MRIVASVLGMMMVALVGCGGASSPGDTTFGEVSPPAASDAGPSPAALPDAQAPEVDAGGQAAVSPFGVYADGGTQLGRCLKLDPSNWCNPASTYVWVYLCPTDDAVGPLAHCNPLYTPSGQRVAPSDGLVAWCCQ